MVYSSVKFTLVYFHCTFEICWWYISLNRMEELWKHETTNSISLCHFPSGYKLKTSPSDYTRARLTLTHKGPYPTCTLECTITSDYSKQQTFEYTLDIIHYVRYSCQRIIPLEPLDLWKYNHCSFEKNVTDCPVTLHHIPQDKLNSEMPNVPFF